MNSIKENKMQYDVVIIGSGPAGYVAAIRAGQVGLKTALIEKKHIGGMCLNWGCIPTKALIESAKFYDRLKEAQLFGIDGIDQKKLSFNWPNALKRSEKVVTKLTNGIDYLLKKNGVDIIWGEATINSATSVTVANRNLETGSIVIATGSYPKPIPAKLPAGLMAEVENLSKIKEIPEHITIFGHGAYTIELAQFFNMIGKKATIIASNENLIPFADKFLLDFISKKLQSDGIEVIYNADIKGYEKGELILSNNKIKSDLLLNCSWRAAVLPPSKVKIDLSDSGYINVDDRFETNVKGIYAVGDVNGLSYLAHIASAQGLWVINYIKGVANIVNLKTFPVNIYTNPEMAQIGSTTSELDEAGINYKISEFPLSSNGKALTEGNTQGSIRLLSDIKYGQVLGVQIIAENATDMIAEASAFMQMEGTIYDVAQTVHAHPTVSEIFMEAGFDAVDKAIHK
jgi:dihydrolipoamide dehydrogenase